MGSKASIEQIAEAEKRINVDDFVVAYRRNEDLRYGERFAYRIDMGMMFGGNEERNCTTCIPMIHESRCSAWYMRMQSDEAVFWNQKDSQRHAVRYN